MKNISFKVEDSVLKRLNYYKDTPEGGKTIIAEFVKAAIKEKCDKTQQLRMGQILLSFPNPSISWITDENKAKVLEVLKEADLQLSKLAPGAIDLSELIAYYSFHYFKISDKQLKTLEENFQKDLEFESEIDEMENAEYDEMQARSRKMFGKEEG